MVNALSNNNNNKNFNDGNDMDDASSSVYNRLLKMLLLDDFLSIDIKWEKQRNPKTGEGFSITSLRFFFIEHGKSFIYGMGALIP